MLAVAVGLLAWVAAAAAAAPPLAVRHGRAIRVAVGGHSEDAVALRGAPGGWRLELAGAGAGAATLVLHDVTIGMTGPRTFELPLGPGALVLDDARFRPDHAYRIEVRRGTVVVGSALIYLQPVKRQGPVVFDDREATTGGDSEELRTSDKGAL